MTTTRIRRPAALLSVAAISAALVAGCGSSAKPGAPAQTNGATAANAVDRAFVAQMIPHHEMAVQMATTAGTKGQHPEIAKLSASIVASQRAEIALMRTIAAQLGVKPAPIPTGGMAMGGGMAGAAKTLGIGMDQMGMSMTMGTLATARPFDRAFIDMMIPHHQGAIRMARAELARGSNAGLEQLATAIVTAQSREISEMNAWRSSWYGAPSPAGGVPKA